MIIAVDGQAASGKGTLSRRLAHTYNLAYLDTGLIYRAVARKVLEADAKFEDEKAMIKAAEALHPKDLERDDLRTDEVSQGASIAGSIAEVRKALLEFQRNFAEDPPADKEGAVLDGRDIGTVVCPNADFKFFVTGNVEIRAKRRHKELLSSGQDVIYARVLDDLKERDGRDAGRTIAPMKAAEDAVLINTSSMDAEEVFAIAVYHVGRMT